MILVKEGYISPLRSVEAANLGWEANPAAALIDVDLIPRVRRKGEAHATFIH